MKSGNKREDGVTSRLASQNWQQLIHSWTKDGTKVFQGSLGGSGAQNREGCDVYQRIQQVGQEVGTEHQPDILVFIKLYRMTLTSLNGVPGVSRDTVMCKRR